MFYLFLCCGLIQACIIWVSFWLQRLQRPWLTQCFYSLLLLVLIDLFCYHFFTAIQNQKRTHLSIKPNIEQIEEFTNAEIRNIKSNDHVSISLFRLSRNMNRSFRICISYTAFSVYSGLVNATLLPSEPYNLTLKHVGKLLCNGRLILLERVTFGVHNYFSLLI